MAGHKVSIIIPCFNAAQFVADSVESALAQTYPDTEIICVDNNSQDNTREVLANLAEKHAGRLQIASEEQQGAPAARNKGIALASGAWLQFLDADDQLLPQKIEHQLRLLTNEPAEADVVLGAYEKFYADGSVRRISAHGPNTWLALINGRAGCTCSNLYRKASVEHAGLWDQSKRSSQEAFLLFEVLKRGARVVYDEGCYTLVRERTSGSISYASRTENWERYIDLRVQIMVYLERNNLLDADTRTALHTSIFDTIRILHHTSPSRARQLHQELVKGKFVPKASGATSGRYIALYKLLGFSTAQKLISFLKN